MTAKVPVERWRSRSTFVLALAIAALGLGNLWRFAWLMGEHGGGPFFFSYLACLFLMGVPLMVAEVLLGRHGSGSPFLTLSWAAGASGRSRMWLLIALLACAAAFLLLIGYLLVAGWSLAYLFHQQLGSFAAISLSGAARFLTEQLDSSVELLGWQLLATAMLVAVLLAGVRRGIGLMAWIAVPLVSTLFAVLIDYALEYGDLTATGEYLFQWQVLDFSVDAFMAGLVHALYTLCIGLAVGMSYGAYAPEKLPIVRSVLAVSFFDTGASIAAGLVVFPILFATNLLPSQGFELLFIALPYAYGNLPFGDLYGALFFLLVFTAVLGTAVALLQPAIAVLEQGFKAHRLRAVVVLAVLAWVLSAWATIDLGRAAGRSGLLLRLDALTAQWFIPAAAMLLALFVGWRMPRRLLRQELSREPDILFSLWYFLIRFVVIPLIALGCWWSLAML